MPAISTNTTSSASQRGISSNDLKLNILSFPDKCFLNFWHFICLRPSEKQFSARFWKFGRNFRQFIAKWIFQTASGSRLQKSAATQEMRRLFRHRPAEYHPAVADRQHDVSAHARAAGLPDQNRTVLAAVQSEHPAQTLRLAARDTAQFDARRQGRRAAVECVTVGTAQKRRTQAHASDPFRRHTAAMRRSQRYDAPAHFIGMGGGKMAQHQPAQAMADEMQRPAAVPACLDKAVQGGGMLRQRLPHAVITESVDGETLFFQ